MRVSFLTQWLLAQTNKYAIAKIYNWSVYGYILLTLQPGYFAFTSKSPVYALLKVRKSKWIKFKGTSLVVGECELQNWNIPAPSCSKYGPWKVLKNSNTVLSFETSQATRWVTIRRQNQGRSLCSNIIKKELTAKLCKSSQWFTFPLPKVTLVMLHYWLYSCNYICLCSHSPPQDQCVISGALITDTDF